MKGVKLNSLGKLARLPRIYRFVKVLKLFRMMKFMKARRSNLGLKGGNNASSSTCTHVATGRVTLWLLIFFILCHTMSCIWVIVANLEGLGP